MGAAYTLGGRVAEAVPLLTQAMEQPTATAMAVFQALCRLALGEAQVLVGRLEEAHVLAERALALALADELGMRPLQAHSHRDLGTLYAQIGRPEPAHAELFAAIELYRAMEMGFWLAKAAVARVEGR